MKTLYTPGYIKRDSLFTILLYSILFYFIKDSVNLCRLKTGKIKILVLPVLLMAYAATAQKQVAIRNIGPDSAALTRGMGIPRVGNLKSNKLPLSPLGNPATEKPAIKSIPNNEDKARAMVAAYLKGTYDADDNYRTKKAVNRLIMTTTLIGGPILGIIPAIACSATTPNNHNLNLPGNSMVSNIYYMKGYRNEAHYIKRHNTWPRFVLASVIWLAVVNLIMH